MRVSRRVPPSLRAPRKGKVTPLPALEVASPSRCPGLEQVSSPCFRDLLLRPRTSPGALPRWTPRLVGGASHVHLYWLGFGNARPRLAETLSWPLHGHAHISGGALSPVGDGCTHALDIAAQRAPVGFRASSDRPGRTVLAAPGSREKPRPPSGGGSRTGREDPLRSPLVCLWRGPLGSHRLEEKSVGLGSPSVTHCAKSSKCLLSLGSLGTEASVPSVWVVQNVAEHWPAPLRARDQTLVAGTLESSGGDGRNHCSGWRAAELALPAMGGCAHCAQWGIRNRRSTQISFWALPCLPPNRLLFLASISSVSCSEVGVRVVSRSSLFI